MQLEQEAVLAADAVAGDDLGGVECQLRDLAQLLGGRTDADDGRDPARDGASRAFELLAAARDRDVIGVVVLAQLPSLVELAGGVVAGVALHRTARGLLVDEQHR